MTTLVDTETEYKPITYAERSAFYETEHATDMDAVFLTSFLTDGVNSVLEVPCGVGRNVFHFAKHGIEVVGVDLEKEMVAQAERRKFDPLHSSFAANISFLQGDMRSLELGRTFDLVVTPIDAFQLLLSDDDALSALKSLGGCVSSRGNLLLDLASFGDSSLSKRSRPIFYNPNQEDGTIVYEWTRPLPNGGTLMRSRIQMHDGELMKFRFLYKADAEGIIRKLYTDLTLRMYTRQHIEQLVHRAGLQIVTAFGNHDREPLDDKSARLIYALRPRS
ncbi:MAG: class I SAM-dependent methyltransferase [Pseudomonadota bacterium]